MILPIVAFGDPVLRKRAENVDKDYPKLQELIDNMFETMYNASGVGIAAPQVNKSVRIFVVDATGFADDDDEEDEEGLKDFKQVFINAQIVEQDGKEWAFNEGCLSIPDVREDVSRPDRIRIKYVDRDFVEHDEVYEGLKARVIQHEYDHIEGILFTDHLSPLRKRMIKGKLTNISKGKVSVSYRMKFPKGK